MNNKTATTNNLDILFYIGVLFRYKWFILITTGIITFTGLMFLLITKAIPAETSPYPDMYQPQAIILVNERTSGDIFNALTSSFFQGSSNAGVLSGSFSYGELALKLIKNNSIIDVIADEYDMAKRYHIRKNIKDITRNRIRAHLVVSYDEKTMLISIGYQDYDPVFACEVVNRFVELIDKRFLSIGGYRSFIQKQLLESKIAEVEVEITELEAKVQKFQQTYGFLDIQSLASEQINMMARFRYQLILKEMEINTYTNFSTIDDAMLKRLKTERDQLVQLINEMESGFGENLGYLPSQKDLPELATEFYHIKRDLAVQEKIYETLVHQYEIIKLSLEGAEPLFQIIENADIPDLKLKPRRSLLMIIIFFIGIGISIVLTFIINAILLIRNDPEKIHRLKGIKNT